MGYYNNGYYGNYYGQQQPNQASGIVWVQGLEGAKSYIVPAGGSAVLMDSERNRFYIKSVDVSGMPAPIKAYEFTELAEQRSNQPIGDFVTREEFKRLEAKIEALNTQRKGEKKHE